jgi:hypothetical protein
MAEGWAVVEGSETGAWLEELSLDQCLSLLRASVVGRIAFVENEFPVVVPVNYRLIESDTNAWLALRTRSGTVIDRAPLHVGFQIDGIDSVTHQGWSVLVRGWLHHVEASALPASGVDPEPWLSAERDSWLVIEPSIITGRRLHAAPVEWAFHLRAYL